MPTDRSGQHGGARRARFLHRFRADPVTHVIAAYAMLGGLAFLLMQTGKLLDPVAAEAEMRAMPFGLFDWGFVWADTLVPAPLLLLGGALVMLGRQRPGRLLVFGGMAVNLYAMLFFYFGFQATAFEVSSGEMIGNAVLTLLCVASMIWLVATRPRPPA